jgi:hypothetical protein
MIVFLSPLLVAGAASVGLLAPFAVGGVPTGGKGIATPSHPFGAEFAICYGSAASTGTGAPHSMLRYAQLRTEVPQSSM